MILVFCELKDGQIRKPSAEALSEGRRLADAAGRKLGALFAGAVLRGESFPTTVDDAIANMAVIDAVYEATGLGVRQPTL